MSLLEAGNDQPKIDDLSDEILRLREKKHQIMTTAAKQKETKDRVEGLLTFIDRQIEEVTDYSEDLVRRLIERITVFDEKLEVAFKAGLSVEVEI